MCTLFYAADLGLLSKNRDKEITAKEVIVNNGDLLGVQTNGDDYFSLCLNSHGVAFASTAVNSPEWTMAVEEGEFEHAVGLMNAERASRESPTRYLSQVFSDIRTVEDAIQCLRKSNEKWFGYNVLLTDGKNAIIVELFDQEIITRALPSRSVVTNHFLSIQHGATCREEYPSSFDRLKYAQKKLKEMSNLENLKEAAHPLDAHDRASIWREGAFSTISSAIIDIPNVALYHTHSITNDYERFELR